MDYKKHIKELEVYSHFDAATIPEIVEEYWTNDNGEFFTGLLTTHNNINKKEAVEALMEWLYDNAYSWYFVNVSDSVDCIKESIPFPENLEEALDMKKAHDILEEWYMEC